MEAIHVNFSAIQFSQPDLSPESAGDYNSETVRLMSAVKIRV